MDSGWIERTCAKCKFGLVTYKVDGSVRSASCNYERAQVQNPKDRPRENVSVAEMSSCPDKSRMAKESGRR